MTRLARLPAVALAVATLALLVTHPTAARAAVCSRGNVPAASLLIPYFEVDLADPGGKTTLFAFASVAPTPTMTRVHLWSDWGIPVYAFNVLLAPEAVQTINLRDVVGQLLVPGLVHADPEHFPACFAPTVPFLGPTVEQVQARLTGKPEPSGFCYSRPRGETTLAVGFVTIDVVRDCDLATPLDSTYRLVALDDNVLWGDVFYVAPDDDSAQGIPAVAVRTDPEVATDRGFYDPGPDLGRLPLDETWRTRFLSGGALDTSTEVVVFQPAFHAEPELCEDSQAYGDAVRVRWGPEPGPLGPRSDILEVAAATRKLSLAELTPDPLPVAGSLELEAWHVPCCSKCSCVPEDLPFRVPSLIWAIHRAAGRFSVGVEATPIAGSCSAAP